MEVECTGGGAVGRPALPRELCLVQGAGRCRWRGGRQDGPGARKGPRGGIRSSLLRTRSLLSVPYWRGGLVSGARTQHPEPGVPVSARLLIRWVTLNNVTFLVPHLRLILCEMNVHVCLCSSCPKAVEFLGSCPRVGYPGSVLGGCSFRKRSCTRLAPNHRLRGPWLSRPGLVPPSCEDMLLESGLSRTLSMKCHQHLTGGGKLRA